MPTIIDELTMTLSLDPAGYQQGAAEAKSAADSLLQKMLAVLAQIEQATKQTAANTTATTTAANQTAATSAEESARRQIDAAKETADEVSKASVLQIAATEEAADRIVAAIKETEKQQTDSGKRVAEHTRGNTRQMEDHFGKLTGAIRRVGVEMLALLGISMTVQSVEKLFTNLQKTNYEAGNLSKSLGMSVKDLTAWQNAAASLGTTSEGVTQFFQKTASELAELRLSGRSEIRSQFRDFFKIDTQKESGEDKSGEELLLELAEKIKAQGGLNPDVQKKLDIMGYGAIAPMLGRGADTMLERKNLQLAAGNVTTPEAAAQADKLNIAMQNVGTTLGGMAQTIMKDLSPILTTLVTRFNELLEANRPFLEGEAIKWVQWLGEGLIKLSGDFIKFLQGEGFKEFSKGVKELATEAGKVATAVDAVATAMGGWTRVIEVLAVLWAGGKVAGMIRAMQLFVVAGNGMLPILAAMGAAKWLTDKITETGETIDRYTYGDKRVDDYNKTKEEGSQWFWKQLGNPFGLGVPETPKPKTAAELAAEEARLAEVKRLREAAEAQKAAAELLAKAARDLAALNAMDEDAPGKEGGGTVARGGGSFRAPTSIAGGDPDVGKGTIEDTGLTETQYTAWRQTLGMSESGNVYSNDRNPKYKGKYQMGFAEIRSTALSLGEMPPTIPEFLNNPDMQERYFKQYTLLHHNELMKHPKYRAMSAEDKAGVRTAAHLAGVQGAISWMEGRGNPSDKNNTTAQQYFDMGRNAVRNAPKTSETPAPAPTVPSLPKPSKAAAATLGGMGSRDYAANDDLMVPEPIGAATSAQRWRMSSTNVTRSHNSETNIAAIHVHTQATDAAGIARDISGELKRFNYVTQADTGLA